MTPEEFFASMNVVYLTLSLVALSFVLLLFRSKRDK